MWDTWNVAHIARHQVTPEEVEEVCRGAYIVREGYKGRVMLIGPTRNSRMLAVILDPEEQDATTWSPLVPPIVENGGCTVKRKGANINDQERGEEEPHS